MERHDFTIEGTRFSVTRKALFFSNTDRAVSADYRGGASVGETILRQEVMRLAEAKVNAARRERELRRILAQVTDRLDGRLSREPGDDEVIRAARELLKEE